MSSETGYKFGHFLGLPPNIYGIPMFMSLFFAFKNTITTHNKPTKCIGLETLSMFLHDYLILPCRASRFYLFLLPFFFLAVGKGVRNKSEVN